MILFHPGRKAGKGFPVSRDRPQETRLTEQRC